MPFKQTVLLMALVALSACASASQTAPSADVVNDVSQMNLIAAERVVTPQSIEELLALVTSHAGLISIGGGRFSQGGQTACSGCLFLDMLRMNRILAIDKANRTISVQAGATWREIQEALDRHELSPAIMQISPISPWAARLASIATAIMSAWDRSLSPCIRSVSCSPTARSSPRAAQAAPFSTPPTAAMAALA